MAVSNPAVHLRQTERPKGSEVRHKVGSLRSSRFASARESLSIGRDLCLPQCLPEIWPPSELVHHRHRVSRESIRHPKCPVYLMRHNVGGLQMWEVEFGPWHQLMDHVI